MPNLAGGENRGTGRMTQPPQNARTAHILSPNEPTGRSTLARDAGRHSPRELSHCPSLSHRGTRFGRAIFPYFGSGTARLELFIALARHAGYVVAYKQRFAS